MPINKIHAVIGFIMQYHAFTLDEAIDILISANLLHSREYGRPVAYIVDISNITPTGNVRKLSMSDKMVIYNVIWDKLTDAILDERQSLWLRMANL